MAWFHKNTRPDLNAQEHWSQEAMKASEQVAQELDDLRDYVNEKVSILHRLNKENNFSAKIEALYNGEQR